MFIAKRRASIETTSGITPHEQRVLFRDMSLRGRYVFSHASTQRVHNRFGGMRDWAIFRGDTRDGG